ncbi:MAG TPA: hypothetical protein PLV19_10080 [Nitrosomonas sp.]|nr:hypothetical protein [Nitrosomonas sp.]HQX14498.1 hypothetical protein [Nitrosomonas sp.]HRB33383.1 hypothetical protein [Nitrosomonas sp.]HRB46654.1 hypothetical protein [Nitrosomonas sp.]
MERVNCYQFCFALFLFSFTFNINAQIETDQISLNQLIQFMAKHKEIHATFTEIKYIKGVNVPLESSGNLTFISPSTIIRNTLQPKPEMFNLTGNAITIKRMDKEYSLQIDDYPEISLYFEGIRALLAGDVERLRSLYIIELEGTLVDWKLVFSPLQKGTTLKSLNINGKHDNVRSVEVRLEDGDYSIMQVSRKVP